MKKILLFVAAAMVAMSASAAVVVAGNGKAGNPWCNGESWNANSTTNVLVDGSITYNDVPAGTYEFKLVIDGNWTSPTGMMSSSSSKGWEGNDNLKFTTTSTSNITIAYNGSECTLTSSAGDFGAAVITSWSIAGNADLMGAEWDPSAAENEMTEKSAGVFELVKKGVVLAASDYEYKASANKDWGVKEIPASGNQTLTIDADGTYDLTFTLYVNDGYLEVVAVEATPTAIDEADAEDAVVAAFDLLGRPVAADAAGYVILQYASGKSAKVFNN
jgi:hypothetical protein